MANHPQISRTHPLSCEEWVAMLTDALDGALPAGDAVAFHAHKEECLACAQLLEEAQRGAEWLRFLDHEPAVPLGLEERILARTSGPETPVSRGGDLPMLAAAGPGMPDVQGWFGNYRLGNSLSILYRHPAESRLLMTVAMAFFSIAFTMNLAGVRLKELHLRDLKPSALVTNVSRGYYTASAHVMRYYENLRFVYELESRVNELRRSTRDASEDSGTPKAPAGSAQPPSNGKQQNPGGGGAALQSVPNSGPQRQQASPIPRRTTDSEPARIIPVSQVTDGNAVRTQPSHSPDSGKGIDAHAPLTHKRDQAERSLA